MSGLLFTSCEWDDWLVKGKPATAMGWSTHKFSEFANAQVYDLKLDITNLNMLFHNGLLSKQKKHFKSGACKLFKCLFTV